MTSATTSSYHAARQPARCLRRTTPMLLEVGETPSDSRVLLICGPIPALLSARPSDFCHPSTLQTDYAASGHPQSIRQIQTCPTKLLVVAKRHSCICAAVLWYAFEMFFLRFCRIQALRFRILVVHGEIFYPQPHRSGGIFSKEFSGRCSAAQQRGELCTVGNVGRQRSIRADWAAYELARRARVKAIRYCRQPESAGAVRIV